MGVAVLRHWQAPVVLLRHWQAPVAVLRRLRGLLVLRKHVLEVRGALECAARGQLEVEVCSSASARLECISSPDTTLTVHVWFLCG